LWCACSLFVCFDSFSRFAVVFDGKRERVHAVCDAHRVDVHGATHSMFPVLLFRCCYYSGGLLVRITVMSSVDRLGERRRGRIYAQLISLNLLFSFTLFGFVGPQFPNRTRRCTSTGSSINSAAQRRWVFASPPMHGTRTAIALNACPPKKI
jgi:hypothetical protein